MGARDLQTMRPGRWEKSFLRPRGRAVSGRGNWRRPELPKKDSESAGGRGGRPREPGGVEPGSLSGNGAQVPLARACQPASCVRHPPGTSSSPQLSPISVPSLPTPLRRGPGATPQPDSEVTAPGTRLEREGAGLLAVPRELADKPLQSPAENRIRPPHHLPNRIKALGSRLEGAGPAAGAAAASSLPIPPRRRGRYDQPWRSFPDAWASAPNGAPSRTLSTGATRGATDVAGKPAAPLKESQAGPGWTFGA
ncbi:uncharacterized protein ACBT57_004326 [Dama dama]